MFTEGFIPLWVKMSYTIMVVMVVVPYWKSWGPKNFLWISDVALLGLLLALWMENSLITSTISVMALLIEIIWAIDLFLRVILKKKTFELTEYMFSGDQPLFIRLLTLFHIPMLLTMVYLLESLGYDPKAVYFAIPLVWMLFVATIIARPEENINRVYGMDAKNDSHNISYTHLIKLMILYPIIFMIPAHFILKWLF